MQAQNPPRQGPDADRERAGVRPHAPEARPGTGPADWGTPSRRLRYFALLITIALAVISWLDEALDLPHLLFGAPATPASWVESAMETFLVLASGLAVYLMLSRLLAYLEGDEQERKRQKILSDIIINESPTLFQAFNPDGTIIIASGSTLDKFGYTSEEVVGKDYLSVFVAPREREEVARKVENLLRTGTPARGENHLAGKNGKEYLIQWEARVSYKENGEVDFVYGPGVDITEQKALELALGQSEARYRLLAENAQDVIWAADTDFRYTYISPSSEKMFGFTPEEIMSHPFASSYTKEGFEKVQERVSQIKAWFRDGFVPEDKRTMVIEAERYRKDGSIVWVETTTNILFDEQGKPAGMVGVSRDIDERKRAEEELRKSEERYRTFIQNLQGIAYHEDLNLSSLFIHGDVEKITGYREEDFTSGAVRITDLFRPEDSGAISAHIEQLQTVPGYSVELVYRIVRKDGQTRWVRDFISNTCGEKGIPVAIQGIVYDITQEKEAEDFQRKSEERYRLLAENAKDVIWAVDRDFKFTYVSPSAEKMFGYTGEEVMREPLGSTYTAQSYEMIKGMVSRCIALMHNGFIPDNERSQTFEAQRYRKDGSIIWVELTTNFIFDDQGKPTGLVGVTRDITARKRAEEAMRESEERYRLLADNIHDVIWVLDRDFKFTYTSPSVQRLRGYTPEEAMVLPVDRMFTESSLEVMAQIRVEEEARMARGISPDDNWVRSYEVELIRKDGSTVWVEVMANDYFDSEGNHTGFVGVTRDISRRKEAEEALRQKEAMYRLLAENAYDVTWATDTDFRFTYVSPSSVKLSGYTAEETKSQEFGEPYTKESCEKFLKYVSKAKAWFEEGRVPEDERTAVLEAERYCRDGSTIWVEISATVLFDEEGKPSGLVGVTRDITARKKTEVSLQQSEGRYRLLADNLTDVIWATDRNVRLAYVSPSVQKMRGYTVEEALNLPPDKMFAEGSLQIMADLVPRAVARIQKGEVLSPNISKTFEAELLCKDGSTVWAEITASYMLDLDGRPTGVVGVTRDITARKKAEMSLQQSEERYRLLTEHIKDVIFAVDLNFRYTYMSPYVETMRGYTPEEAMAMPWVEVVTPRSLPVLKEVFASAERRIRTEGHPIKDPFRTFEMEVYCKDGSTLWTEVTGSLMYGADGKPFGYVGITRDISERKKAEESLQRSEERYRLLADNVNDVIWAMDRNFRYTYVSPSVEKMRGYTVEEAMALPMSKVYAESSYRFMQGVLNDGRERQKKGESPFPGEVKTFEVEMNCKDGSTRWVEVTVNAVITEDGALSGFVGVTRDISERKKAEDAMRQSEERYRLLADNVDDVIWAMGPDLTFTYISPSVKKMSGYTVEEVMDMPLEKGLTGKSFRKVSRILSQSAEMMARGENPEGNGALTYQLEYFHKDGSLRWIEVKSTFILDADGRPAGAVGVARDITERKQQEEALLKSEETYRTIFESTGTAMLTIMEDGTLSLVNDEFEKLSGYSRQEIEGNMHWRAFVVPEEHERLTRYRDLRVAAGDAPKNYEFRFMDRSGTIKDVHATATVFPGTERVLMSLQDITRSKHSAEELKYSQEQLRNLLKHSQDVRERERTRVAREIHDELGQVLTGLKMDLSFLAKKLPQDLSELRTKTNLMLRFVDMTIQSVKRITMDLRPGLLDHLGLVAAIEWQAEEFQKRSGIRYRISVTPEDINLTPEQSTSVFRIFQETLTNIAKYSHATEVRVSLVEKGGIFEMTVSDNGIGISKEQMENPKSFGLMGIQERAYFSGGKARIFGQKGKGTTVKITIPLDQMRSLNDTSAYRG